MLMANASSILLLFSLNMQLYSGLGVFCCFFSYNNFSDDVILVNSAHRLLNNQLDKLFYLWVGVFFVLYDA